ncbi:ProQ/FINO family protein [Pseudoalteromonas sp.]|uniref:ProQ/FINO family protein n=1 Tax=Pseudoalteromonas sp. TaxID=53249 RepID=UPI00272D14DB|nr:ProQ/FINO family protein [Pseudoalteromonas sp.]
MRKTLTLGGVSAGKSNTEVFKKPEPKDKEVKAFEDMGWIIEQLYKKKIKTKWMKPLSKSFYKQLREIFQTEEISSKRLNAAIRHHVKSPKYLLMIRTGAQRFDVYGKADGRISAKESKHALEELYKYHGGLMRDRRKRRNRTVTSNRTPYVKKRPGTKKHRKE